MKEITIHCTKSGIRIDGANNIGSTSDTLISSRSQFMRVAEHWWNTYCADSDEADVAENATTTGNAAAMREALTDLCNAALKVIVLRGHDAEDLRSLGFYMDKANFALAKPPKNCDRFKCFDDAWTEFKLLDDRVYLDSMSLVMFAKWLFAEAKGEDDGK